MHSSIDLGTYITFHIFKFSSVYFSCPEIVLNLGKAKPPFYTFFSPATYIIVYLTNI